MSEFVVIAGLSGAGRTQAAAVLEDLGWFVIDNVPAALIPKVGELATGAERRRSGGSALVVRASGPTPRATSEAALDALARLGGHACARCSSRRRTDVLVRRYEDTRRRHPLGADGVSLAEAIERERELLQPLKGRADVVVDTSDLNVHQLRARIVELFGDETARRRAADQRRLVRLQARPAPRRRPRARLPVPAEPALGRGAPPADAASTRRCATTCSPSPTPGRSSTSSTGCSGCCCRRTCGRARPTCRSRSAAPGAATGRSSSPRRSPTLLRGQGFEPTVTHRDVTR